MSDIYIYDIGESDFSTLGICGALIPTDIKYHEIGNANCTLSMIHPIDSVGRYKTIVEGRILKTYVPVRNSPEIVNGNYIDVAYTYKIKAGTTKEKRYIYSKPDSKKKGGKKLRLTEAGDPITVLATYEGSDMRVKVSYSYEIKKRKSVLQKTVVGYIAEDALDKSDPITTRFTNPDSESLESLTPSWQLKEQLFRIYSVQLTEKEIKCEAQHISYDATYNMTTFNSDERVDESGNELSESEYPKFVIDGIVNDCFDECNLTITTNISTDIAGYHYNGKDPITALLDPDIGIVPRWNAKLLRDNESLTILADCGADRGIRFEYGKNLTGIDYKADLTEIVTAIRPEGADKDGNRYFLKQSYQLDSDYKTLTEISGDTRGLIFSPLHNNYPFEHIQSLEGDDCKIDKKVTEADVIEKLKQQSIEALKDGADAPSIVVDVDVFDLATTSQYRQYEGLERVFLWDFVTVHYSPLNINLVSRVTEIEWDVILDRVSKVTIGEIQDNSQRIASWQIRGVNGIKIAPNSIPVESLSGGISGTKLSEALNELIDTASNDASQAKSAANTATQKANNAMSSVDVEYYLSTSTTAPVGGSWVTVAPEWVNGKYMWSRTKRVDGLGNVTYTPSSSGTCIAGAKGEKGDQGQRGIQGEKGADGTSVTIKGSYSTMAQLIAAHPSGSLGDAYIVGMDLVIWDGSAWKNVGQFKGQDGVSGYAHVAWANSSDGRTDFSTTVSANKTYIGFYTDNTEADSTDPAMYSWSLIKGEKGDTGATGTGIVSIIEEYYISDSKDTQTGGSWVETPPTWISGKYIWTRSKITYKNPTSVSYTTPICDSSWEAANNVFDELQPNVVSANEAASAATNYINGLDQFVRYQEGANGGLTFSDGENRSTLKINSGSVSIGTFNDDTPVQDFSQFTANYVRFGNYYLRKTADGGLAFKRG